MTQNPYARDELATLLFALDRERAIFRWKTGGLDAAGLATTVGKSTITLGGLVKHLAAVEDDHFARLVRNERPGEPWASADWESDPDWDWTSAANDTPEQVYALYEAAVARAKAIVDEAVAKGGLDGMGAYVSGNGFSPNVRRVVVDMVTEYARHNGHADILREAVDGLVGEDPPGFEG